MPLLFVQQVTPLIDGRASPAQLTGRIQRGDILLAIDGVCLADNNALVGLKPLQAPDDPTVPCPLTREQMQKLVDVGAGRSVESGPINFADFAISTEWDERFAELLRFKNENGHTDVSEYKHKDTHFKLGVWVRGVACLYNCRVF